MKKKPSINLFLIPLFLIILQAAHGQSGTFPRLDPDPKALEYYRLGRQRDYTWAELAEISLWASGDSSASNMNRIRDTVDTLNKASDLPTSPKEKAEFILTFLHRNTLRSYSLQQTRIDTIYSNGRFNCVSSAVLYTILCAAAGINTSGVITRDHALVMAHIGGEDIDVETTNRFGFDPGNRREFHDQFGRSTGFTYVPARNYRDRQTISKIQLVSLILNNRISELERQNRYFDSVPLAIDRAALLLGDSYAAAPGTAPQETLFTDPYKDMMDRLFNYGSWLLRSNREEDCLRWAVTASAKYPDEVRWQEIIMAAVNNRTARLIRGNNPAEARNFLEAQKTLLTETNYKQLDTTILDAELLRSANQIRTAADGDTAVAAIVQAQTDGRIAERRGAELLTFAVQRTASILSAAPARDWRAAITYLENAVERFGANREFEQALRTYRGNLVADYHNRFAAEWNKRNYEAAERILNEALAEFPNERQLLADKDIVNRHHSR